MKHPDTTKLKLLWKWEAYAVYELNSEKILRIRYAWEKYQNYASEQKLLSFLYHQSEIFPQLLEYDEVWDWWVYTRINWVSAASYVVQASIEEKQYLMWEICRALLILHSIDWGALSWWWYVDVRSTSKWNLDWLRDDVKSKLWWSHQSVVENILKYINKLESFNYPNPTMTHGDVSLENIIVDPKNWRLAGIIDFSDGRVADPALDFDNLWCLSEYVWWSLNKHTDVYGDIASLQKRAEFYSKRRYLFSYLYNFKHSSENDILRVFGATFELENL